MRKIEPFDLHSKIAKRAKRLYQKFLRYQLLTFLLESSIDREYMSYLTWFYSKEEGLKKFKHFKYDFIYPEIAEWQKNDSFRTPAQLRALEQGKLRIHESEIIRIAEVLGRGNELWDLQEEWQEACGGAPDRRKMCNSMTLATNRQKRKLRYKHVMKRSAVETSSQPHYRGENNSKSPGVLEAVF